jgi:hypothetical protein
MKDVGLRIRVQRDLRDKFIEACRRQDVPAAHVLRAFMRDYVTENGDPVPNKDKPKRPRSGRE